MAGKGRRGRAVRSVLGANPPDVYELAFNELTGTADRACGCFELKDVRSGSWIRFKECEEHGRKVSPGLGLT